MLEDVRKRLRSLVKFIEKTKRQNIYTDFADLIGEEREIDLPGFAAEHDLERFRDKTQQFLRVPAQSSWPQRFSSKRTPTALSSSLAHDDIKAA